MKKVIVLLSGGMDSVTALYDAQKKFNLIGAITFNYGSKHNKREIPFAKLHCDRLGIRHEVVEMTFINDLFESALLKRGEAIPDGHYEEAIMKKTVVPFRNGIMLSIACGFAESIGADGIVIAAHSGDHAIYPDCRSNFIQAMSNAMRWGTYANIELIAPFVNIDKTEIARIGNKMGIDYSETWSCYKGKEWHCGTCGTCVERKEAMVLAGIKDKTRYS